MSAHFVILIQMILVLSSVLSDRSAPVSKNANHFDASEWIKSGVKMSKTSPFIPLSAKGIIVAGSALADGYDELNHGGNWKLARARTFDSAMGGGLNVVRSTPGTSLVTAGVRAVDGYRHGDNFNTIITDAGTEAIRGAPGGKVALVGLKAARSFHDGESMQEIAAESGGEVLRSYTGNNPALKNIKGATNLRGNVQKQLPYQVPSSLKGIVNTKGLQRRVSSSARKINSRVPTSPRRTNSQNNNAWKRIRTDTHQRVNNGTNRVAKRTPSNRTYRRTSTQPSRSTTSATQSRSSNSNYTPSTQSSPTRSTDMARR